MKILVTGGAGFIGRWLLRHLSPTVDVVVVDLLEPQVHGPGAEFPVEVRARAECICADVQDVGKWSAAATGCDVVVHLASQTGTGQSMYQEARYIEHNVEGTKRLCEGLATLPALPRSLILASSRAVYGEGAFLQERQVVFPGPRDAEALAAGRWELENHDRTPLQPTPTPEHAPLQPSSVYGITKVRQEQIIADFSRVHGLRHVTLRLQNVYGPWQQLSNPYTGIIGTFANGILRDGRVELFEDGLMTRDFVSVKDVVATIVTSMADTRPDSLTLNVGTGQPLTLRDTVALMSTAIGRHVDIACRGRYRLGDVRHACADMTAYSRAFGAWKPIALAEGLADYVEWFREQPATATLLSGSLAELTQHGVLREPL
jgi:dTDP-L-rhamnose 4-epimerase